MRMTRNFLLGLMVLILATSAKINNVSAAKATDSRTLIEKIGLRAAAKVYGFKRNYYDPNKFYIMFAPVPTTPADTYIFRFVCGKGNGVDDLVPANAPVAITANLTGGVAAYNISVSTTATLSVGQQAIDIATYTVPTGSTPFTTITYYSPTSVVISGVSRSIVILPYEEYYAIGR